MSRREVGALPAGVTPANHDELRDRFLMFLLLQGEEVYGDWDHWHLTATGATSSQLWGSERTFPSDRTMLWWLTYKGGLKPAKEMSDLFGSRHPVKACLAGDMKLNHFVVSANARYERDYFIGHEFEPIEPEKGEFIEPPKSRRLITYRCKKCGREFHPTRRYRHLMQHKRDGGDLELVQFELEKR